jgi:hypothetical protein
MTMQPDGKSWSAFLRQTRLQVQHAHRGILSSFTWDNLFAAARTLAWLVPLTVLIWLYAEREQVFEIESVPIPITVTAGGDLNLFVELQAPQDAVITAKLNGPRGRLEDIRQRIMPQGSKPTVVLTIDRNHVTPGSLNTIDTAQALSTSPVFANSGVTVSNCSPAQLKVYVDDYTDRVLEVQRPTGVTNLVGTPDFDPRKVTLRGPRRNIQLAEERGPITVEADLSGLVDKPGPQVANNVPLVVRPVLQDVTLSPNTVRASFEVRAADVKWTYPSMGVSIEIPQSLQETSKVNCISTLPNVELVGPPDQIALLQQEGAPRPTAQITVTVDAVPNKPYIAKPGANLTFKFPPGAEDVQVNPETLANYSIEWTLVERTPADQ